MVIDNDKIKKINSPLLLAILMALEIHWCNAEHIAQYGKSRATLDDTGRHHWASICPVSPQQMQWSSILA
jgi:hypothetical protein